MNPLQYTSEEMFSSTELIRKSKNIFEKLNGQKIEKAVILRDGKPSFMLLDFATYEKLMKEYLELKEKKPSQKNEDSFKSEKVSRDHIEIVEEELSQDSLEEALKEIENLDLGETALEADSTPQPLKEFWEK